jgi:hypothetical protein
MPLQSDEVAAVALGVESKRRLGGGFAAERQAVDMERPCNWNS